MSGTSRVRLWLAFDPDMHWTYEISIIDDIRGLEKRRWLIWSAPRVKSDYFAICLLHILIMTKYIPDIRIAQIIAVNPSIHRYL